MTYCPNCECPACKPKNDELRRLQAERTARANLLAVRQAAEQDRLRTERDLVLRQGMMIWLLMTSDVDQATIAALMNLKYGTVTARLRYFQEEAIRRAEGQGQHGFHPWAKRPHTDLADIPNWELRCPTCGRQTAMADRIHHESAEIVNHRAPTGPAWQRRCPGSGRVVRWTSMLHPSSSSSKS